MEGVCEQSSDEDIGPRKDEVVKHWEKLHLEDVYNLYSSHNFFRIINSRNMKWVWHVVWMGKKCASIIYIGNYEVQKPLKRITHRWEDNIKMDLK